MLDQTIDHRPDLERQTVGRAVDREAGPDLPSNRKKGEAGIATSSRRAFSYRPVRATSIQPRRWSCMAT
jgi:hypothetical protein